MRFKQKVVHAWRDKLTAQKQTLETRFYKNKNAKQLLKAHTRLIDSLLIKIWRVAHIDTKTCLIATGGYGRSELFPHSDIDLLILISDQITQAPISEIEQIIGALWDVGLNVGHSVRNLNSCIQEAAQDATVQTNLLESRLIAGNPAIFSDFYAAIESQLSPISFLNAKIQEQKNRHKKLNGTAYSLEPNLKESSGGLRDLHTILWLSKSQQLGETWRELLANKVINKAEFAAINRHQRYLNTLRIRLHYLARRREDQLLFDFQNTLAENLGIKSNQKKHASEQLMQQYYRSAHYISFINEMLVKLLCLRLKPKIAGISINDFFVTKHNLLEAINENIFINNPSAMLECFLLLQKLPQLEGLGPTLLRQLQSAKHLINASFRQSDNNKKLFLQILSEPIGVHHALRRMNSYGILGRYIPVFNKVIGQMQHDLFHVYTVDEHTLKVLANLRRFSKAKLTHEFPLCSQLFANFDKPHLLYIAAIFHDIAKGRGGDHSALGGVDAKRFCKLHCLPKIDTNLVVWLVTSHLTLSHTAQKSDLSDPAVIQKFAQFVGDEYRLTALYLLTVADIRGTSPAVWNAWKARLLESLFIETKKMLNNNAFNIQTAIKQRQEQAQEKLSNFGLNKKAYQMLWDDFGKSYFTRHTNDEIAWHTRLLIPHHKTDKAIVRAQISPSGDGIRVVTYMRDNYDLFARICNFFDRIAYNIGQAVIYTTKHGYALNTFIILDQHIKSTSYTKLLLHIEQELTKKLAANMLLEAPLTGHINRQVKHMPFPTEISIEKIVETNHHIVNMTVSDQPGILASIAAIFLKRGIQLHNAKINTLGNRAEDNFLISGQRSTLLSDTHIALLIEDLKRL